MNKKSFKAQALALVMIVLVVASIIGVSLFSRMAKDKELAISEQDSSIASTQVDAMLDFLIGADIQILETVLGESGRVFESMSAYGNFLAGEEEGEKIIDSVTKEKLDVAWCPGESSEKVSINFAEPLDFFEVQPGSVMAYSIGEVTVSCNLALKLKAMDEHAIFVVKRVYDNGGVISETTNNYCINQGVGGDCPGNIENVENEENLQSLPFDNSDKVYTFDIDLQKEKGDKVVEIRFLPIKGVLGMAVGLSEGGCAGVQFKPIKITAEANCNGSYRGKQMFLPGSGSLGYSTIFDYGIYDSGLFQP